jgi:hypothetical protein
MRIRLSVVILLALVVGGAGAVHASPILSVDTDPSTAGIQSTSDLSAVTSFSIDIVISDVDPTAPLNGFEFDLDFDSALLTAVSVIDGGFLLDPVFVVQNNLGVTSVEFAEVTLLPTGASGSGILATIAFDVIGDGTSVLDLNDVLLSAPFGVPIATAGIFDGTVSVGGNPIPEPSAALLFGAGLVCVVSDLSRRGRITASPRS